MDRRKALVVEEGVPVLLMFGYAAGALPEGKPLPAGVALLRKPFTISVLLRALDDLLKKSPVPAS